MSIHRLIFIVPFNKTDQIPNLSQIKYVPNLTWLFSCRKNTTYIADEYNKVW